MLNGYCVSGFCLSTLAFIGSFSAYAKQLPFLEPRHLYWFDAFRSGALILFVLGMVFSLIGIVECRKHEQFGGRGLGITGAILGLAAAVHWLFTTLVL
ncbi:MAG: hypothetical protein ACYTFG_20380 [Planctomycetota bacterium]|jgi:hypothetical protein